MKIFKEEPGVQQEGKSQCRVALATTSCVHWGGQERFVQSRDVLEGIGGGGPKGGFVVAKQLPAVERRFERRQFLAGTNRWEGRWGRTAPVCLTATQRGTAPTPFNCKSGPAVLCCRC